MSYSTNPNNATPESILKTNSTGIGRTDKTAELYSFEGNTLTPRGYEPVKLSDNILKALFIKNFHSEFKQSTNVQAVLDSYSRDYLGTFHERSANKEVSKPKNPIASAKKVLTASEYRMNHIKLGLDVSNAQAIEKLVIEVRELNSKTSKAQVENLLNSFSSLFFDDNALKNYKNILKNEQADAKRWQALTDAGFENIARSGAFIAANIALDKAKIGIKVLREQQYTLVSSTTNLDTMQLTVQFNEEKEEDL